MLDEKTPAPGNIKSHFRQLLNSPFYLAAALYVLLVISNFACLTNPPYWDDILGLHNHAVWLAKHNFDFVELWQPGQDFWDGGSNIYRFGIMPIFYGILYSLFSPDVVHVIGHLFNMACVAAAFGISYSLLRKFKVENKLALLWCLAAVSEPVMSGRVVALGQECPLLCAAVAAIYFIADRKYWKGLLLMLLAMLFKMTAGLLAAAFLAWLALDILFSDGKRQGRLKQYLPPAAGGILLLAFFIYDSFLGQTGNISGSSLIFGAAFEKMVYHYITLLPIQFVLLLLVAGCAITGITGMLKTRNYSDKSFLLFLLILTGGYWTSYALFFCSLPRYTAFIVFPMYIFVALSTFKKKRLSMSIAVFLLIAGLMNINGYFYFPLRSYYSRSGEYLERSREYLDDLWSNQAACKLLEKEYFDRPIVAKWPFVQMLTMPEMGYVSKALPDIYNAASIPAKYVDAEVYYEKRKMPDNTLYIFSLSSLESTRLWGPSLLPQTKLKYKMILKNQVHGGWFVIYEKEPEWRKQKRLKKSTAGK